MTPQVTASLHDFAGPLGPACSPLVHVGGLVDLTLLVIGDPFTNLPPFLKCPERILVPFFLNHSQ
jgi:hypothetical protein